MGILSKPDIKEKSKNYTSENFFIGAPEAEAETAFNSRMKLGEVFEDFLGVLPQLKYEKFIIMGRKGSGKTALAEYLYELAREEPNSFCRFIRKRDIDIEKIVQIGQENNVNIRFDLLFEWIILINLTKLIIKNESIKNETEFFTLEKFIKKNSGFINIDQYQINEFIQKNGYEISIEYFKRFFKSKFGKDIELRGGKAPFYKMIPYLKETVFSLLDVDKDNEYFLIFDDLDLGFSEKNNENVKSIIDLLRVTKDYNINFFGKNNINSKIIILIRDDIAQILTNFSADTAKIFSSYGILLSWFSENKHNIDENNILLKKFINKRIKQNFKINKIPFDENNPWESLIESGKDSIYFSPSTFRFVLNYTFYRPRDLILLFKPLPQMKYPLPIQNDKLSELLVKYTDELINEIKNELALLYDISDIRIIFNTLKYLGSSHPFGYEQVEKSFIEGRFKYSTSETLTVLFNYSLIGNLDFDGKIYFKCREKRNEPYQINFDMSFVLHNSLNTFFSRKLNKS